MKDSEDEIEILRGIYSEVQDLNAQLARIDERSQQNADRVHKLRTDRIVPLENQTDKVSSRSKRNALILGGALTVVTLVIGAAISFGFAAI